MITFIFHYHYQWNKADEKQRNKIAILEHLACIEALQSQDRRKIDCLPQASGIGAPNTHAIVDGIVGHRWVCMPRRIIAASACRPK